MAFHFSPCVNDTFNLTWNVIIFNFRKVFQRRVNGSQTFFLDWNSYKAGFGSPRQEVWLGNDKLYYMTNQKNYQLRIDLVSLEGEPFYAKYNSFRINDEDDDYRLVDLGSYMGNTGLWSTKALKFSFNDDIL